MDDARRHMLTQVGQEFAQLRRQAERALAQVDDAGFVTPLGSDGNSLAVLVKHLAGNLRSRWTAPLTTDGEKPDRHRDGEFELGPADTRATLMRAWAEAFTLVEATLSELDDSQLDAPVVIRGQPQSLGSALLRSLTHLASHVGQMVQLARYLAGPGWTTLSIPRGQSEQYLQALRDGKR